MFFFLLEPEVEQKYNVLQTLLATPGLSAEDVKVTIIDFIAGGIFTVSNSLAYLCYHLASNPEAQEKLAEEIQTITANRSNNIDGGCDDWITASDIASMSYLKACVKESFRLNCPVPGIMRVTSKPLVLSGYEIPENVSTLFRFLQFPILIKILLSVILDCRFLAHHVNMPFREIFPGSIKIQARKMVGTGRKM